jgi:hypothetical protein
MVHRRHASYTLHVPVPVIVLLTVDAKNISNYGYVSWLVCLAGLWCLTPLKQYFSYIVAVRFIGGGNRRTRRKPPTCRKSVTNFNQIMLCRYVSHHNRLIQTLNTTVHSIIKLQFKWNLHWLNLIPETRRAH